MLVCGCAVNQLFCVKDGHGDELNPCSPYPREIILSLSLFTPYRFVPIIFVPITSNPRPKQSTHCKL